MTQRHRSTLVRQAVFYSFIMIENAALLIWAFIFGHGKMMLPDGNVFCLDDDMKFWWPIVILPVSYTHLTLPTNREV